jgi:hypothetical protein
MANLLKGETSPYLLQHADNPVDWHPWGNKALNRAKTEGKAIFLSIGYSACHWCHVMAHESFEDPVTGALMNQHFINIKVDREERPDLDHIYMQAVQAMTGSGGWPMSVFLTPEGLPFYGGTYFPPEARHGLPSFRQVLRAVAEAWRDRRDELVRSGSRLLEAIANQEGAATGKSAAPLTAETLTTAFRRIAQQFDRRNGGWGGAPKFPQPMTLEFLLRYYRRTEDHQAWMMINQTLEAMARGGMYDQLGGGFHRYSVDERWLVPHFEKMLYDNAQLARVYLHGWQVTGSTCFRTIAEEILDYVVREMVDPAGGFYSAQDADSDGEEGAFFLWSTDEVIRVLERDWGPFLVAYGVTERGNLPAEAGHNQVGKNVLEYRGRMEERPEFAEARRRLLPAREGRPRPARDDKVLASWNGLMLAAFSEAARALEREDYRRVAERNADFLLRTMRQEDGRLWHSWRDGRAGINGFLEDYANLVDGLVELYQTTFDPRWYREACRLADGLLQDFGGQDGILYDTGVKDQQLITRPRDLQDNATPSGNAMAAFALLRLGELAAESRYRQAAESWLARMQPQLTNHPLAFGQWLVALDFALGDTLEVAIAGDVAAADTQALLAVAQHGFQPYQVVAAGLGSSGVGLLRDRIPTDDRATAYVCRNFTCRLPVNEPRDLAQLLGRPMVDQPVIGGVIDRVDCV